MADRRILFLDPLGETFGHDQLFADMAERCKLPGTEVTVASLPDRIGGFSHIEYRSYEAMAALKRAEYDADLKRRCGWIPSRKWSCEPPPEDELARVGVIDGDAPALGARIVVPA